MGNEGRNGKGDLNNTADDIDKHSALQWVASPRRRCPVAAKCVHVLPMLSFQLTGGGAHCEKHAVKTRRAFSRSRCGCESHLATRSDAPNSGFRHASRT